MSNQILDYLESLLRFEAIDNKISIKSDTIASCRCLSSLPLSHARARPIPSNPSSSPCLKPRTLSLLAVSSTGTLVPYQPNGLACSQQRRPWTRQKNRSRHQPPLGIPNPSHRPSILRLLAYRVPASRRRSWMGEEVLQGAQAGRNFRSRNEAHADQGQGGSSCGGSCCLGSRVRGFEQGPFRCKQTAFLVYGMPC